MTNLTYHSDDDYNIAKFRSLGLGDLTGKTVLDIGCNSGAIAQLALDAGAARVVGIDGDAAVIEMGRELHPNLELHAQRWSTLPEGPYDVILMLSAIHYENDPHQLLRRIFQQLRAGGLLVIEGGLIEDGPIADLPIRVPTFRRVGDRVLHFTRRYLEDVLFCELDWRIISRSPSRGGDPIPRSVVHVSVPDSWAPKPYEAAIDFTVFARGLDLSFDAAPANENLRALHEAIRMADAGTDLGALPGIGLKAIGGWVSNQLEFALAGSGAHLGGDCKRDLLGVPDSQWRESSGQKVGRTSLADATAGVARSGGAGKSSQLGSTGNSVGMWAEAVGGGSTLSFAWSSLSTLPNNLGFLSGVSGTVLGVGSFGEAEIRDLVPSASEVVIAESVASDGLPVGEHEPFVGTLELCLIDLVNRRQSSPWEDVQSILSGFASGLLDTETAFVLCEFARSEPRIGKHGTRETRLAPGGMRMTRDSFVSVVSKLYVARPLLSESVAGTEVVLLRLTRRRPQVLLARGASGSGKTVLADDLAEGLKAAHVSCDQIYLDLVRMPKPAVTVGVPGVGVKGLLEVCGDGSPHACGRFFREVESNDELFESFLKVVVGYLPKWSQYVILDWDVQSVLRTRAIAVALRERGFRVWSMETPA